MIQQRSFAEHFDATELFRQRRPHSHRQSIPSSAALLFLFSLLLFWVNIPPIITTTSPPPPSHRLRPIILDESRCPLGWKRAAEECVQLQYSLTHLAQAERDCQRLGAKLVNILDKDGEPQAPLIEDISDTLEEALNAGVPDQSWLIGSGSFVPEWDSASERVRFRVVPKSAENEVKPALGLRRRRGQHLFDLVLLSNSSAHPFVCALSPLWRRIRLYQQSLLPRGAPKLEEEPQQGYSYDPTSTNDSFLSLPCSASGDPLPTIRWFRNGGEEIDLTAPNSPYIVSAGAFLIPLSRLSSSSSASPVTFHCLATNPLGTVRSQMATVRPAFIEPFRESRLDAFPLISGASKGGGARLECNVPRHFPRSFSFSWVRGGSYEKFVEVSPRLFISMEGTLYFAYNLREDEDSYACTLTSAATQSAQHGPFFRLFLPLGHINPKQKRPPGKMQHPHSFPPRMDDFQPQLFQEVPTRGQSIYLECFAYGFPVPTYRWTRVDGLPLPPGRHKLLSFGRILRIDRVEVTDSGRFRCTVQNELGIASGELKVAIQAPPTLLLPLTDRMLAPGTPSVTLHCHVADAANGPLQIEWFHDGIPLAPLLLTEQDRDRFKMDGNELLILNVQRKDSGIYQCSASNEVGSVSSSALLQVERLAPRFHANVFPSRLFIVEGSQLRLPCLFQSSPPGKAQWSRITRLEGTEVERPEPANSIVDGTVPEEEITMLTLDNAHLMDSGLYKCEARTESGMAQANVWIEVIPRPQVSIRSENGNGDSIGKERVEKHRLLTCELEINCTNVGPEGCPEALFSWEFNDRPIRSLAFDGKEVGIEIGQREQLMRRRHTTDVGDEFVLNQQSQLKLPAQFVKEQVGRFACNSLFGGAIAELEPPPLAIVPLKLSIQEVDHSSAKLLYRTVQSAIKHQGTTAAMKRRGFTLDGKTEQPRIYQLEARTGRERRWRPVKKIELNGDGNDGILADLSGQIQLDGLEPNEKYQFRLRPDGHRVQSVSLSDWIQTPQSVPTQPVENLRFRMLDDRHILLEWDPIERGGHHSAPGLVYNVSWALGPNGAEIASELVNDARMVINLPPSERRPKEKEGEEQCTILEVGVRPTNLMGPSKTATNTVIRASDKAPQRFAVDLRMETVNSTHLNLSWHWKGMDPCENVIGAKIVCIEEGNNHAKNDRDGEAEKSPNASSFSRGEVSQSVPADYVQWMVHSLRAGLEYTCRVLAFDQYGRMGPSKVENMARGRTAEQAPVVAPEIIYVLVKEASIDGYALLLDWRAVALSNIGIEGSNMSQKYSTVDGNVERARQRGYKIFVYVSETANRPIELTLTEAELHDAQRPSARIDGLRPMFFYGIQVAAFNPGGIGPRSERIPVRIGAREQSNPALFGHPQNGANKSVLHFSTIFLLIFSAAFILIQSTFFFRVIHEFLSPIFFP